LTERRLFAEFFVGGENDGRIIYDGVEKTPKFLFFFGLSLLSFWPQHFKGWVGEMGGVGEFWCQLIRTTAASDHYAKFRGNRPTGR